MCARYGRGSRRQRIEELLGIEPSGLDDFTPLYNITKGIDTMTQSYLSRSIRRTASRCEPVAPRAYPRGLASTLLPIYRGRCSRP
jgi:hypothetical protein